MQDKKEIKKKIKGFIYEFYRFFYFYSGRFFPLTPRKTLEIAGKNLVEAWEKVLVTSGYTGYAKNPRKSSPTNCKKILQYLFRPPCLPKHRCVPKIGFSADMSSDILIDISIDIFIDISI